MIDAVGRRGNSPWWMGDAMERASPLLRPSSTTQYGSSVVLMECVSGCPWTLARCDGRREVRLTFHPPQVWTGSLLECTIPWEVLRKPPDV